MSDLTNEQIIEEMAKAEVGSVKWDYPSIDKEAHCLAMENVINRLTELGYQITKIEPDEEMLLAGMNATNHPPCPLKAPDLKPREGQCELQILRDLRCNQYKAMSNAGRVSVEDKDVI